MVVPQLQSGQGQDDEENVPLKTTKDPYITPDVPRKIEQVEFGLMSSADIIKNGEIQTYETKLYKMPERKPHPDGVLDPRLGVSGKFATCKTCGQLLQECVGHFGYIKLMLPVFHIGYMKKTIAVLSCICKTCSRVLLDEASTPDGALTYMKKFRSPALGRLQREMLFKTMLGKCKNVKNCPHCGGLNGQVKKVTGNLKIIHDKYSDKLKQPEVQEEYRREFRSASRANEQLAQFIPKAADDLNPVRVLDLFRAIPDRDRELLDLASRPEDLLMTAVPVPPVTIRPSVEMEAGAGSNEDDITMKLMHIIEFNNQLRTGLQKGVRIEGGSGLMEIWDFLQIQVAMFINSDLPGLPPNYHQASGKPLRGFVQRLKGKQGRFRGNLSGKRVDFSGRTVISPDPNLGVDEVGVPDRVAKMLSIPEQVTDHNIAKLRQRVLNGKFVWPGANMIYTKAGGKFMLQFQDRTRWVKNMQVGDMVERHLDHGDVVLFNRQPSLHRVSIMAHKARIVKGSRTLRFNECVCAPYNADFDGDEMNIHVPQTLEARAEALTLMGVHANLRTPKNGDILVAATQDFLTSSYLLTSKDCFYTREQFGQLVAYMGDALDSVALPPPAIILPQELWTGKQLFSLLVRPSSKTHVLLNLELGEKVYKQGKEEMCPNDGWVCFRNSDLMCGRLGKGTLGDGNKKGLFHVLVTDFSPQVAARCMNRLAKLSARFIGNRGFSIGIDDVTPARQLQERKQNLMDDGHKEAAALIQEHAKGVLKLAPGMGADETLESKVQGLLSNIRTEAGDSCMISLSRHNSPLIMSQCGSKGSPVNIAQMVACVGQQVVNGKRAPNGFTGRALPHFQVGDRTPEGKGFVAASFYSGLAPTEFFFHAMAGREGLVDTAVKTAETGYMSRRLMKSLEDLHTHHDNSVRNSSKGIVQMAYGDDGLDPLTMEGKGPGEPLNLARLMTVVRARRTATPPQAALPSQLRAAADLVLEAQGLPLLGTDVQAVATLKQEVANQQPQHLTYSSQFVGSLHAFIEARLAEAVAARQRLGLPEDARADASAERAAALTALTETELRSFLDLCISRYDSKRIDPGSTVGAFGAQSIGEPGTQMTLKTFHFAGVAAMNITLGVPRIKEIIDAAKKIKTPIVSVALPKGAEEEEVRALKARIEATTLGQVAPEMRLVLGPNGAALHIRLDLEAVRRLQLSLNAASVALALAAAPRLKIADRHIRVVGRDRVVVSGEGVKGRGTPLWRLQALMSKLPAVVVAGIPTITRAVMNRAKDGSLQLFAEGTALQAATVMEGLKEAMETNHLMETSGFSVVLCTVQTLQAVMGTEGVHGESTETNHVMETWACLGIEAARAKIIQQIDTTMASHGMAIDARHMMLLADCMTYKGEVLGITRFGIAKMKESVLMLASFEKTVDHLFDAAVHGRTDQINGVSESVIMGMPVPCGSGMVKLKYDDDATTNVLPVPRAEPLLCLEQ